MANNTITIRLEGEVSLQVFTSVIQHFRDIVDGLSATVSRRAGITWTVEDLQAGSASATVAGLARDEEAVERVVHAYTVLGRSLERSEPLIFPDRVAKPARAIVTVLGPKVTAVRFETPEDESTVISPFVRARPVHPMAAYSAVEGRIETVTRRKGLRFVLYDALNDRAVSCYLREGQEELMRDIWGKRAIVEGWLSRDPITGLPTTIRNITNLRTIPEIEPGGFRRARGAAHVDAESPSPEEMIRRLRDA